MSEENPLEFNYANQLTDRYFYPTKGTVVGAISDNKPVSLSPTIIFADRQYTMTLDRNGQLDSGALSAAPNSIVGPFAEQADGKILCVNRSTLNSGSGGIINGDKATASSLISISSGGRILDAAPDGNGGYYLAGTFTSVNGQTRNRLAHINSSGSLTSWNPNVNGDVVSIARSGNNVYFTGSFTQVAGQTRNYVAAFTSAGSIATWAPTLALGGLSSAWWGGSVGSVTPGVYVNETTSRIRALGDNIYFTGWFGSVNSQPRFFGAAVNTSGSLIAWSPGINPGDRNSFPQVQTMEISPTLNEIVIGGWSVGAFCNYNRQRLAVLNTAGSPRTAYPDTNGQVRTAKFVDNTIYIGGAFTSVGSSTRFYLAAINTSGSVTSWAPNIVASDYSYIINRIDAIGSNIYFCGTFIAINGERRIELAAVNTTGSLLNWAPEQNIGIIETLIADTSGTGRVFVSGDFVGSINGIETSVRRIDRSTGDTDTSFASLPINSLAPQATGTNINHVSIQNDGKAIVVGDFTLFDGRVAHGIARINTDGTKDETFVTSLRGDGESNQDAVGIGKASCIDSSGRIYIGGNFFTIRGTSTVGSRNLARLLPSGEPDQSFIRELAHPVELLVRDIRNGFIYVGSEISTSEFDLVIRQPVIIDGEDIGRASLTTSIAPYSEQLFFRLLPNGDVDTSFMPYQHIFGSVIRSIHIQDDGKILVGGVFFSSTESRNIARFNPDGTIDSSFTATVDDEVSSITTQRDGKILIGGSFGNVNGTPISKFARLYSNGSLDGGFIVDLPASGASVSRTVSFLPTTVANQQIRIVLNSTNFSYARAKSDGSDLRFYNSTLTTSFSYWIERWNTSGESVVWVKIPASSTSACVMTYGNSALSSQSNIDDVMDEALLAYYYGSGQVAGGAQAFQTLDFVIQDTGGNIANYNWTNSTVSISGFGSKGDYVSIRWRGWVKPTVTGTYTFLFTTDDGQRLYVESSSTSRPIASPPTSWTLSSWVDQGATQYSVSVPISDLNPRFIWNEWFETGGFATSQLGWQPPGGSLTYPIPSSQLRAPKFSSTHGDPFAYSATIGPEGAGIANIHEIFKRSDEKIVISGEFVPTERTPLYPAIHTRSADSSGLSIAPASSLVIWSITNANGYTVSPLDVGKCIIFASPGSQYIYVLPDSSPIGSTYLFVRSNNNEDGFVEIVPQFGAVVRSSGGLRLASRGSTCQLIKVGVNEWLAVGRLVI